MKLWPFGKKKTVPAAPAKELAVPTYLLPYWKTDATHGDAQQLAGTLQCKCGCQTFQSLSSNDDDRLYHAVCKECREDVLLFDANTCGWDALICGVQTEDAHAGETAAKCPKCGCEHFGVTVWVEPTDKQEFISCNDRGLPESEWVHAYTWFAAHLTCADCGHRLRDWADIETA